MKTNFNPEQITLPPELEGKPLISPDELGALLGVTGQTILNWGKKGYLELTSYGPRCYMMKREELYRYIREGIKDPQKSGQPTEPVAD